MTDKQSLPNDEARIAALIRATGVDAPPPDAALLAKLRERTIAALDDTSGAGFQPAPEEPKRKTSNGQAGSLPHLAERRPMVSLMIRACVALAAVVLIAVFAFNPWTATTVSGAPFSQVLKNLRDAESLRLHVLRGDTAAEVWISRPGLVRWEESPEKYQVAAGSRWWKVDESENTVATGDSPWFRSPDQQVDLLAMLDLGVKDAQPLLKSRPAEKLEYDGQQCFVYRTTLQGKEGPLEVEAFTNIANGQLVGILARPPGVGPFRAPLAEMRLIAVNEVVDESKFVVAKTLTEDGRIGKLTDAQGIVVLRPMLAKRWTPVVRETLIKPGDWLRTELRGANAVRATLSSDVEITLGPGSLLECISPTEARLHNGSAQVNVTKKDAPAFTLLAPREGSEKYVDGKHLVRVNREDTLVKIDQQPIWLKGFEGTANNESLGSLIVNLPDGRNEPLTVGYHKVSVEIRDQIARTTIEESFVNHTDGRLEGVFHFPLPQDASISGFGMWIGNDLVEADIVEKQRAREIYETILRERRDPGLLEWTSGNLFKARVFPIEPNSEKRIKIVYTQVLPLRGNRYRYSYALRSDLLQTKPLRELSLSVLVNSALPLKSVTCPTHTVRTQQTPHSAQIDYSVQEHTPTRDFEVVFEVDRKQADVVAIPHRRGDDGYLLLQLLPPGGEGDFQREVLADGEPLNLVLLCDTSASMDSEKRRQQAEFVAAILASLSEKDRFNVVAADVGTAWAFPESVPATADNSGKAQAFLADRLSLGWTNLERAFDDVLKKSPAGASVVYIGDGIVSAGETDPSSFVKRLGRLIGEKAGDAKRSFHAVTVGNTHEAIVLKGIATVAGGSVRGASGEQTPQKVALELLNELAQPALQDVNIEFRGVKVAGMYPERLPNLAAGTQQILVGRYLPTGADQQGKVIVTGMKGKEKVRYEADIKFVDAEEGNSFIPRLWARSHLDQLLGQGQSQATRDEIIALSEEFHIITPYTSLLVLESDADRERFGVKRRYEMRDGERFFAEGKANANYELLQQQMKRASDWRIALRRQMLRQLALLGRNPQVFQRQVDALRRKANILGDYRYAVNGPMGSASSVWDERGGRAVSSRLGAMAYDEAPTDLMLLVDGEDVAEEAFALGRLSKAERGLEARDKQKDSLDESEELSVDLGESDRKSELRDTMAGDELEQMNDLDGGGEGIDFAKKLAAYDPSPDAPMSGMGIGGFGGGDYGYFGRAGRGYYRHYEDYTSWVSTLFPPLAAPTKAPPPAKDPEHWPAEAIALAKSLLRTEWAAKLEGGLELRRVTETFNPNWQRRESHNSDLTLYSTKAWLTRTLDPDDHCIIEFANDKQRGAYSRALLLGRVRNSVKQDLAGPPAGLEYFTTHSLHLSQRTYKAKLEPAEENQIRLILTNKEGTHELRYTIDTARHVVLKLEQFSEGKLSSSTTYSDFVEVAGAWFSTKSTIRDEENREIGVTAYEFKQLAVADFGKRMDEELGTRPQVQFLSQPLPKLSVARQKVADGAADFNDRMVMVLHYCQLQKWDEVLEQVTAIEKAAEGKPGVRWLRPILYITMRRNDEARQLLLAEVKKLAAGKSDDDIYLADFVLARAQQVATGSEMQEFVNILKPVYERQPKELNVFPRWENYLLSVLESLNHKEEALALRRKIAEQNPWDVYQQTNFASYLNQNGRGDEAVAWLQQQLARPERRTPSEDDSLRNGLADQYRNQSRWGDLLEFTAAWIAKKPTTSNAYQQHLSALVFNEQLDAANALAEQWLKENRVERKLTADERARLDAAIYWAQGNAHNLSFQRMDERWPEPLRETALYFVRHKHHFDIVQRIFDYRFGETDQADRVRGEFLTLLRNELPKLTSQQISYFVSSTLGGRLEVAEPINGRKQLHAGEVPNEIWAKIAAQLKERWAAEKDKEEKHSLGEALKSIYANRFSDSEYLPYLRERLASAAEEYRRVYRSELFEALLTRPWEEKLEAEAFALLLQLPEETEPPARLAVQVPALYRLVDAMIANRNAVNEKQLGNSGDSTKLTRTELAKKRIELRKAALAAIADRLDAAAKDERNPLTPWLRIEQTWLNVRIDRNLQQAGEFCWKILDVAPPKPVDPADEQELDPAELQKRFFDAMLHHRALLTVMNLAARKNAEPASVKRVEEYFDKGIEQKGDSAAKWRSMKFVLLVALDRADDLDKNLRQWIRDDVSTSPWRTMLGILVAERGKLAEAVQLFEAAEKDKLLSAAHYKMLADWYLVLDRRQAYERSRVETFKQLPEYRLSQIVYRNRNRWYDSNLPLPTELDEETLFAFRAIFEKSGSPEQYLWHLRDVYAACRDFRLLDMLPDAMLGRSPQQVYGLLGGMRSYVLQELRNEAAADEVLSRITTLRAGERTATDLRALDLLEALIERQSSEVPNQPGPHAANCLAALKRAFEREWGEGEPRMMARFLSDLSTLHDARLVDEQIRELRALQKMVKEETRDHLYITRDLTNVLFWSYHKRDEAIRIMQIEHAAWLRVNNGRWTYPENDVLSDYVHLYEGANRHFTGEAVLLKEQKGNDNVEQRKWLEIRLLQLYRYALDAKTEVSLGAGDRLFVSAIDLAVRNLETSPDDNHTYYLADRLNDLFRVAHDQQLASRQKKLRTYAFETLPQLLKRQRSQYRSLVTGPIDNLQKILGHKAALQYVAERLEQYPQWLDISWDRGWNALGSELARQRHEAATKGEDLKDLEPRVLKLAIAELKRYLRTGESQSSDIYHVGYSNFWKEKKDEFAKAAEEVYLERKTSGRRVVAIAHYLWSGLSMEARAIEMLLIAWQNGILDDSGQETLVNYLHSEKRFAESIPILQKLIELRPDHMRYRALLLVAYHHAQRKEQLMELLAQTDKHFHQEGRWTESNIGELAGACNTCGLYEQSVGYFNEAISQRQRNNGGVTLGDGALSGYYQGLAFAHSSLFQTKEAVDAASAAIVCWGPRHTQRVDAVNSLRNVLTTARDLHGYVKILDKQAAETGQDSVILRKTIGQVYKDRGNHAAAVTQLKLAVDLQPNDKEVHQWLIQSYDALGDKDEATRQLLKQIDFDRHDLKLYTTLAARFAGNEAQAERAATSIIEAAPTESENHTAFAELMQSRNRWDEAIPHWQQVAELRRLEPTGLLKLAEAQIHGKKWNEAQATIKKLQQTSWPARFNNVENETRQLQERLPK